MLMQLPSGSNSPGPQNAEETTDFESALRRDLASAPIVSYDDVLGGWRKRLADFSISLLFAPLWMAVMLAVAAWLAVSGKRPVIVREECIGYGGRAFRRLRLNFAVANQAEIASDADNDNRARTKRFIERLPQFINILAGDMAIVGPTPLTHDKLEPLKSARRYYLSARPGIVGLGCLMEHGREEASAYKRYAMSWALSTDAVIVLDALSDRDQPAQDTL